MRTLVTGALGVTLALGLSGCGGDGLADRSTQEIKQQVTEDMRAATSLRLDGELEQGSSTIGLDLNLDDSGNCRGTVAMDGAEAELLLVDGAQYFKGSEDFWSAQAGSAGGQISQMLGDKWAKMPAGGSSLGEVCQLDSFVDEVVGDGGEQGDDSSITKGEVTEVEGREALELRKEEDAGTTRMWVATGEQNHIVRVRREGDQSGEFVLSEYDEPVDVAAPAEGEYVDLAELGG